MSQTKSRRRLLALTLLCALLGAFAQLPDVRALDANGQLEDPALQLRFERITKELR
jgi:hypothetical protein